MLAAMHAARPTPRPLATSLADRLPLLMAAAALSLGAPGCGSDAGGGPSMDGGADATVDAAPDAWEDAGPADGGDPTDLSGESACCVGAAAHPDLGAVIAHVGLDSGRVVVTADAENAALSVPAASVAFVGGVLYLCSTSGEEAEAVLRVEASSGAITNLGVPCAAITSSGERLLVLDTEGVVSVYDDEDALVDGDAADTFSPGGLFSRIGATADKLVLAWHSDSGVRVGPLGGPYAALSFGDYDGLIQGVDLVDGVGAEADRVVISGVLDGEDGGPALLVFDAEDGARLAAVRAADGVTFDAVACGSGPAFCPAP